MSESAWPHRRQPTRLPRPWDSPGKNTGVGCHFLLQGMKVKSESEVAQSCPTLSDPRDCSLPGSSVHGIFQARVLERVAFVFSSWVYIVKCHCEYFWKKHSNFIFAIVSLSLEWSLWVLCTWLKKILILLSFLFLNLSLLMFLWSGWKKSYHSPYGKRGNWEKESWRVLSSGQVSSPGPYHFPPLTPCQVTTGWGKFSICTNTSPVH